MTSETAKIFLNKTLHIDGQYFYNNLIGDNATQAHWQIFFDSFAGLGNEEMLSRSNDIARFLKENGVMYNVHGEPSGLNRAWNLDAVPFFINAKDWTKIESGLLQRAELFNLILKDIYGAQRLIKDGVIPME